MVDLATIFETIKGVLPDERDLKDYWEERTTRPVKSKFSTREPGTEGIYSQRQFTIGELGPPKIAAAAIKLKSGKIFTGSSHMRAVEKFDEAGHTIRDWKRLVDDADGFVTDTGEFITRKQAARLTGQKSEDAADIVGKTAGSSNRAVDIAISGKYTPEQLRVIHRSETDRINKAMKGDISLDELGELGVQAGETQKWREAAEILEGTHKGPGMEVFKKWKATQ